MANDQLVDTVGGAAADALDGLSASMPYVNGVLRVMGVPTLPGVGPNTQTSFGKQIPQPTNWKNKMLRYALPAMTTGPEAEAAEIPSLIENSAYHPKNFTTNPAKIADEHALEVQQLSREGAQRAEIGMPHFMKDQPSDPPQASSRQYPLSEYAKGNMSKLLIDPLMRDHPDAGSPPAMETVRTDQLYGTQDKIWGPDEFERPEDHDEGEPFADYPLVARTPDGKMHILDGHHRLNDAIAAGQPYAQARVYNVPAADLPDNMSRPSAPSGVSRRDFLKTGTALAGATGAAATIGLPHFLQEAAPMAEKIAPVVKEGTHEAAALAHDQAASSYDKIAEKLRNGVVPTKDETLAALHATDEAGIQSRDAIHQSYHPGDFDRDFKEIDTTEHPLLEYPQMAEGSAFNIPYDFEGKTPDPETIHDMLNNVEDAANSHREAAAAHRDPEKTAPIPKSQALHAMAAHAHFDAADTANVTPKGLADKYNLPRIQRDNEAANQASLAAGVNRPVPLTDGDGNFLHPDDIRQQHKEMGKYHKELAGKAFVYKPY